MENIDNNIKELKTAADLVDALKDTFNLVLDESGIDPENCTGSQWNFILDQINKIVIRPDPNILKMEYFTGAGYPQKKYDIDLISSIYSNYYFPLCNRYNKRISIKGFLYLTGINNTVFYDLRLKDLFSNSNNCLLKKVKEDSEESLINLMGSEKSALPYITELNSRYGWAAPPKVSAIDEQAENITLESAKNAFELFQNNSGMLPDNGQKSR